jgi:Fe-S-cluster-containing dehydrogenase component/formate-dependent nitrite reductase membrane component NrfD
MLGVKMVQLGFVIDHGRCIGCHACTVACKSENEVPLGKFRTWVKYTEEGEFPTVDRSFAVLRCNQCSEPPCVDICPVNALEKRESDGIVDIDDSVCIGCKGCMQACPYDALYLNDETGTAEKCHFCAHRTEIGLAPACAVVCPTEAIIPGDFHDPLSLVSLLKEEQDLRVRKEEAGTSPNVFYKEAAPGGLEPLSTNPTGGYLWANQSPLIQYEAEAFRALEEESHNRTTYDVEHPPMWGSKVSAYLFTKSIAAGAFLAALPAMYNATNRWALDGAAAYMIPILALVFLLVTTALLIFDLKKPERFYLILTRPNWKSWLAKGSIVLMAYGGLLTAWLGIGVTGWLPGENVRLVLVILTAIAALLTACYTAWLFAQAKGRVLWMRRSLAIHLIVQAILAGLSLALLFNWFLDLDASHLRQGMFIALAAHLVLTMSEGKFSPEGREEEYARVHALIARGPFAGRHWNIGMLVGVMIPALILIVPAAPWLWSIAAIPVLIGLFVEEDVMVQAGQALPIS